MITNSRIKVILFVILFFLFNCSIFFSQTIFEEIRHNEGCDTNFVRLGCSQFYYSKFSRIELISINPVYFTEYNNFTKKVDTISRPLTIIIDSLKLDFTRINERSIISNSLEIRNLLNLLYKNNQPEHLESFCGYQPRNGILFYDKKGKLVGFLEICFQCHESKSFGNAPEMQNYCNEMMSALQNFFLSNGIKYRIPNK